MLIEKKLFSVFYSSKLTKKISPTFFTRSKNYHETIAYCWNEISFRIIELNNRDERKK